MKNPDDQPNPDFFSDLLGEVEVIRHVRNSTLNRQTGRSDPSPHQRAAGVLNARDRPSAMRVALSALPASGTSESQSVSESTSQQIQVLPLLRPDEIALQFARESGTQLLLIKGRRPVWCLRVDYYSSPWFVGRYVSKRADRGTVKRLRPFGERAPEKLRAIAGQFTQLR